MKKLLYPIFICLFPFVALAQNLVPNGDFETYSPCPSYPDQIYHAIPWHTASFGTPDYYHPCTTNPLISVPVNLGGYQQPHSGLAYAGIYLRQNYGYDVREYMEVELTSPLVAGSCYFFEMYVNLIDSCNISTSSVGVHFSNTLVNPATLFTMPFPAHISNTPGNFLDTASWKQVSGTYTAQGGESFLIIGNYNTDLYTDTLYSPGVKTYIYAFFDDVSLTPCTGIADGPPAQNISVQFSPDQASLLVNTNTSQPFDFTLLDISSRKIMSSHFSDQTRLSTAHLPPGLYIWEAVGADKKRYAGKVIKR